jgi:O-antigen/teichoic acid export membrane protein
MTSDTPHHKRPHRTREGKRGTYDKGFSLATLNFLGSAVLGLAASVVVARLYGITVVGEYALVVAPAGAVWLLSTVREQPALMRKLTPLQPRDARITGMFAAVLTFSFALTTVVSVIIGVLTWFVFHGPIDHPHLILPAEVALAASLVVVNTCWNLDTILGAFRAGRPLFWCRLHQALVYLVLSILLSRFIPTVWGLLAAWYGAWASSLVQRLLSCRAFMPLRVPRAQLSEGFAVLPELLRFGLKMTPGFLAEGVSDEAGTWILGLLAPVATIGAYSRAWMAPRRGLELTYRVCEMLFPTLIERRQNNDRSGYNRALVDSLRYMALATLLPAAVAAGAATPIMSIYGRGFTAGAGAFAYLVFVPGVITLSAVQSQALFAEERGLLASLYGIARAATTLLAGVLLTRAYGVSGTGAGMLIGACIQLMPLSRRLLRSLDGALAQLWSLREIVSLLSAAVAGFFVSRLSSLELAHLPALLLAPTLGLSTTVGVFIALGGVQPRDRERGRRITLALNARWDLAVRRIRSSAETL